MWPWQRHRRAAEAVHRDVREAQQHKQDAEQHKQAAEWHQQAAELQAAHARTVTSQLRREIDKNGWTELLQHAWGGR